MLEQQGFYFHPHRYLLSMGHPQLDFDLLSQPNNRSANLKLAHFLIWENGSLRKEALDHPVQQADKLQVLPGRFSLQTFDEQTINGFCFGGELQLDHFPDFTRCHLTSPAPIGNLNDTTESPQAVLFGELLSLLAMERVGIDDEAEIRNLAEVEPFQLFVASLAALDARAKKLLAAARTAQYQQLASMVAHAIAAVKEAGEWPNPAPTLEELLS